jgi:hypothetical protein
MSSNGSNDTQLGRLDSLFGSQGSTRNFTSLLNPSYLQSTNGKESHKRETDGKYLVVIVQHNMKKLCALLSPSPPPPPSIFIHGINFVLYCTTDREVHVRVECKQFLKAYPHSS